MIFRSRSVTEQSQDLPDQRLARGAQQIHGMCRMADYRSPMHTVKKPRLEPFLQHRPRQIRRPTYRVQIGQGHMRIAQARVRFRRVRKYPAVPEGMSQSDRKSVV